MKPKFALDLSHEGINLLHRARGGWELVGSLALDDSDMGPHLAELRRKAERLEAGGITTKIIIPNSQILYTVLEAPGPDDIAREVQIRSGLDGLTPYPVGELVFDWRADGERARVAVLARETMDEAESFAVEHGFNPVSFVARPASGEFSGEPF
ncbi:MAG: translation initiation factor 2, partial [Maritimibacter sp.]|nr:translation initiation factor 2 [Maritimibacter sp.]